LRDLAAWLSYQEQAYPRVIDLGLERLGAVLQRLNWRRPEVPVITVAGTNGKGSVSAYCAAILQAAGLRAGLFTSPHLRDYRERLRIGEGFVSAQRLIAAFERIEAARGDIGLTFFEYNTLAALLTFEEARLDAWVLEVGLGGRLDAVNIIDPDVAVVVSIGLDHQDFLGDTLEAIGAEKAGIFRGGRTAVLGSQSMPASVERRALEIRAPLKRLGREFTHSAPDPAGQWQYCGPRWTLPGLPIPALFGATQLDNASTAIAALEELEPRLRIPAAAVAAGLRVAQLPARFQIIDPAPAGNSPEPRWILDVAHNPAAAAVLARNLRDLPCAGRTFAVFGVLADKDAHGVVEVLAPVIDHWWLAGTEGPRGLSDSQVAERVGSLIPARFTCGGDFQRCCEAARAAAGAGDRIVAFGSFHSVGPVLDWLEAHALVPAARIPEYNADLFAPR
jgi:dihydrofolate synthase / folylpolyglutamate synthase